MYEELKERSRAVWSTGDYTPTSHQLEPVSEALVQALGVADEAGLRLLDVGAGHGNCAMAAARRGAAVVATDFSATMIETGSARTRDAGLDVVWQEADAAALPFADASFDRVTSVFGAIFAPEQEQVAAELVRVVRAGGLVGLTSWTPDGLTGQVMAVAREFNPVGGDVPNPSRWGDPDAVHQMFDGIDCDVSIQRRTLTFRYSTWEAWRQASESHGMAVIARQMMEPASYENMRDRLRALTAEHDHGEGDRVAFDSDYLEIIVRKR